MILIEFIYYGITGIWNTLEPYPDGIPYERFNCMLFPSEVIDPMFKRVLIPHTIANMERRGWL
jgi:hypothetical protein